jgi:broad specificity phosphatase PhoE
VSRGRDRPVERVERVGRVGRVERVVLVRHGETDWSRARRHTGRTDLPLDAEGCRQAAALRSALSGGHATANATATAVFTSPLRRARETAELAGFGSVARVLDDLVEWDYGDLEGRTTAEIRAEGSEWNATEAAGVTASSAARSTWSVWTGPIPGGESLAEVGARADAVIERILPLGGEVVLFSHAHLLRVLAARWCGLPPIEGRRLHLSTASVSVLGWERDDAGIELWNHVPVRP